MSAECAPANVSILRQSLHVVSIPLVYRERAAHLLLKMLFFSQQDRPNIKLESSDDAASSCFFALTETPDEFSLLIEQSLLSKLQALYDDVELKVGPHVWRALEVSVSDAVSGSSAVAPPLSDAGVTIMYHSSMNSDYLLVPDNQLGTAIVVLERANASICFEDATEEKLNNNIIAQQQTTQQALQQQYQQQQQLLAKRHVIEVPSQPCVMGFLQADVVEVSALTIIQALLFPSDRSKKRFLSLTQTPEGLSYIIPSTVAAESSIWERYSAGIWSPVKLAGPLDFETCGYVSLLSCALSSTELPSIYLSTFFTDYALVQEAVLSKKVLAALARSFDIIKADF